MTRSPQRDREKAVVELLRNANAILGKFRAVLESPGGAEFAKRIALLAQSEFVPESLTTGPSGWAAFLNMGTAASFSAARNRKRVPGHKPCQSTLVKGSDLLRSTAESAEERADT